METLRTSVAVRAGGEKAARPSVPELLGRVFSVWIGGLLLWTALLIVPQLLSLLVLTKGHAFLHLGSLPLWLHLLIKVILVCVISGIGFGALANGIAAEWRGQDTSFSDAYGGVFQNFGGYVATYAIYFVLTVGIGFIAGFAGRPEAYSVIRLMSGTLDSPPVAGLTLLMIGLAALGALAATLLLVWGPIGSAVDEVNYFKPFINGLELVFRNFQRVGSTILVAAVTALGLAVPFGLFAGFLLWKIGGIYGEEGQVVLLYPALMLFLAIWSAISALPVVAMVACYDDCAETAGG